VSALRFFFPAKHSLLREQRRATRVRLTMPVLLYGRNGDEPFQENTETLNVSANGGLVPVSVRIRRHQKLIVTNLQTNEDLACRVVRLAKTERGTTLAAIEFFERAPRFWRANLPPNHRSRPGRKFRNLFPK
jgi:hypothetical protein